MRIIDLIDDAETIEQIAAILVAAFALHYPDAWPNIAAARLEVRESLAEGRISRVAVGDDGTVLGWVGGIPDYDGNVYELHPLAVLPSVQRQGVGRALVADLEQQVRQRGAYTITLGSDDQDNQTSLSGVDLYDNLWQKIQNIQNLNAHPYEFYQKCGYTIVGVMPDANGRGQPDIIMAKRVRD